MELLTIRECSLGAFVDVVQEAVLQGYRHSQDPTRYSWVDNQYNTILERPDADVLHLPDDVVEGSVQQSAKKLAGRPPRKL